VGPSHSPEALDWLELGIFNHGPSGLETHFGCLSGFKAMPQTCRFGLLVIRR
jgi:hypothetical protein